MKALNAKTKVGDPLKSCLSLCFRTESPVLLEGKTGIGKTEIVLELASDLGIECRVLDLSIMEPVDLIGLPEKHNGVVQYLPPAFLPTAGAGILFLDELNRAQRQMMNASLQLLSARRLNQYTLPKGWLIAAAVNPDDDENYDTYHLDDAMLSRFIRIEVEACVEAWLQYAEQSGHHQTVIELVRSTPKIFDGRLSNPRAWTRVSNLVFAYEESTMTGEPLQAAVRGCVGADLSTALMKALRTPSSIKVPAPEAIVKNYSKVRRTVTEYGKRGDTARLESCCRQLFLFLQRPAIEATIKGSKREAENLVLFRSDLPAEFQKKLDDHAPWIARNEVK